MGFKLKERFSVVTTAYNEEENLILFYNAVKEALKNKDYELIIVNDGSTDNTFAILKELLKKDKRLKVINLKHNAGKSFALYTGLKNANNEIIATIDADLENDPKDILKLFEKLNQGYDFINGWRFDRKDGTIKRVSTKIGNYVNNKILKVNLCDNNCPLKVFKKECIEKIIFFKRFHRFIPILVKTQNYKIYEEKVQHFPRQHGKSKYGVHNRIFGNLKTLFTIKFKSDRLLKN